MATPMADGEITDRGRHRRIGRGRDRKLSEWTMPRECNPCSGGLALFKGRPREQQLTQPPKPKLIRHTFGRMTNNRRRCCHGANSFTSVHVIFWPLMSMGSDVDRGDIADRPPRSSSADKGRTAVCVLSPSLDTPAPHRPRPRGCSRSRLRSARPPHQRLLTRRTTRHLAPCTPSLPTRKLR